ncbi:unnamed protein product [Candida parapsilosis]
MGAEVGRGNRNEKYYDTEEFSDLDEDDEEVELSQEEEEEGDDFEDGNINEFDRPLSYGNDDDDDDVGSHIIPRTFPIDLNSELG